MKDIQGVQRGKCNASSCECEEYRAPSKSGQLRCDYCDHTPREHVKIIQLGGCTKCGKDECNQYVSEDPNSYTECEYCGCDASVHAGAEQLRKQSRPPSQPATGALTTMPPAQGQPIPQQGGGMVQAGAMPGTQPGFSPRQDAYGQPMQQASFGNCIRPGCSFPKRKEGNKLHDFCSRTCSKKFADMQSTFHQQKVAAAHAAQQGGGPPPYVHNTAQQGGGPPPSSQPGVAVVQQRTIVSKSLGGPTQVMRTTLVAASKPVGPPGPTQQPIGAGGKTCSKCHLNPANPGRNWCEPCYRQSNP